MSFITDGLMNAIGEIFRSGIEGFLKYLLKDALSAIDSFLNDIVKIAFHSQEYMTDDMGLSFDNLFLVVYSFGYYLIILKFLKKGFDTYIAWSDGDADMDPFTLATALFKAIIIAVSFNTLYGYMVDIATDLMNKGLNSLNNFGFDGNINLSKIVFQMTAGGITFIIFAIVYLVCYFLLWIQFIRRGLEIFVLRLGVPLACAGLMDSDGGVFKPYMRKFFQEVFTVILQTFFLKLSMFLIMNGHPIWGIAAISGALKAPQFLQEFIMVYGGGGQGIVSKTTQTMYTANMIRSFAK